jgi:hypothetical protein
VSRGGVLPEEGVQSEFVVRHAFLETLDHQEAGGAEVPAWSVCVPSMRMRRLPGGGLAGLRGHEHHAGSEMTAPSRDGAGTSRLCDGFRAAVQPQVRP